MSKSLQILQHIFCQNIVDEHYQSALIKEIIPGGDLCIEGALRVYSEDYYARLTEALGKNFEGTWLLLGDDDFFEMAKKYIKNYPSDLTNLTNYGEAFPEFLRQENVMLEVVQMADFEQTYWERFHQRDFAPIELSEEVLTTKNFDLSNIKLIESSFDLEYIFKNREKGVSELAEVESEHSIYFALYKAQAIVAIESLSRDAFEILCELKTCHSILKLYPRELTPVIWSEVFNHLKFSRILAP